MLLSISRHKWLSIIACSIQIVVTQTRLIRWSLVLFGTETNPYPDAIIGTNLKSTAVAAVATVEPIRHNLPAVSMATVESPLRNRGPFSSGLTAPFCTFARLIVSFNLVSLRGQFAALSQKSNCVSNMAQYRCKDIFH